MKVSDIKTVGVIGAGQMGAGIAQVLAEAGFEVYLSDQTLKKAKEAKEEIANRMVRRIEKKRAKDNSILGLASISDIMDLPNVLKKIHPIEFMSGCCLESHGETEECKSFIAILEKLDFVVEAVFENLDEKRKIFRVLDQHCRPEVILATNTSSIKIADIADAVSDERKPRVIGMHFMNPPYKNMELEIVISNNTSGETFQLTYDLAKKINREPIIVAKDVPGFLSNRILMPSILEALRVLEEGVGRSVQDVNLSVKAGVGGAMNILELGDFIGWDIVLSITQVLNKEFGVRYDPPKILYDLVKGGYLGRKTKKGVFDFVAASAKSCGESGEVK